MNEANTTNAKIFECNFSIKYLIDNFRYDKTIEVLMATFCSLSVLLAALKAYRLKNQKF